MQYVHTPDYCPQAVAALAPAAPPERIPHPSLWLLWASANELVPASGHQNFRGWQLLLGSQEKCPLLIFLTSLVEVTLTLTRWLILRPSFFPIVLTPIQTLGIYFPACLLSVTPTRLQDLGEQGPGQPVHHCLSSRCTGPGTE